MPEEHRMPTSSLAEEADGPPRISLMEWIFSLSHFIEEVSEKQICSISSGSIMQ